MRTLTLDQGFLYLNTGGTSQSSAAGAFVTFTALTNTPVGSGITVNGALNQLTIKNIGYYQITFGISLVTTSSGAPRFGMSINGGTAAVNNSIEPVTGDGLINMTVIIHVTTANTTIQLQNTSVSGTDSINDVNRTGQAPAAYMTIIRLQ
jgi:hypothetical protein